MARRRGQAVTRPRRSRAWSETIREAWAAWRIMGGTEYRGVYIENIPKVQREMIRLCRRVYLKYRNQKHLKRSRGPLLPK